MLRKPDTRLKSGVKIQRLSEVFQVSRDGSRLLSPRTNTGMPEAKAVNIASQLVHRAQPCTMTASNCPFFKRRMISGLMTPQNLERFGVGLRLERNSAW